MDEGIHKLIVVWTARLAVTAYLVRLWSDIRRGTPAGYPPIDRSSSEEAGLATALGTPSFCGQFILWVWTIGCCCYLLHVFAAFQFIHDWSHAAAYEHTALQTAAVTGWSWGGGLWINYAFTVWWPLDVFWCWQRRLDQLPHWYVVTLHLIVGFLMFNATVVFGPPWWRWAGAIFLVIVVMTWLRRVPRQNSSKDLLT